MYPYHNTIKKRIKNGELVGYEYVSDYKNIGECLLLHFKTPPQAAIRAGYSPKTAKQMGQRLLTFVDLKAYIDEQLEQIRSEKTADAQEVLEYLTAVMRGLHTEQTLQLVGEGVQKIADIDVPAKERIKAAELIGKRYGLFTDKVNVEGCAKVVIVDDLDE